MVKNLFHNERNEDQESKEFVHLSRLFAQNCSATFTSLYICAQRAGNWHRDIKNDSASLFFFKRIQEQVKYHIISHFWYTIWSYMNVQIIQVIQSLKP